MFTKIDKKILAVSAILLILIFIAGLALYGYIINRNDKIKMPADENTAVETSTMTENIPDIKFQNGSIQMQDSSDPKGIPSEQAEEPTLTVCVDKCGDGICQKKNLDCKDSNLNCVCQEMVSDCPQDCK